MRPLPRNNNSVDESNMFAAQIERAILQATHGRVGNLHVENGGSEIVLYGRCPTFTCKQLAQDSVCSLIGEARLTNRIEVH